MEGVAGTCTAEEAPLLGTLKLGLTTHEKPSLGHLMAMTIFVFPISLIWATMGMVVLPAEALRLYPNDEALYLGLMLTVVAFSQLICPVVGKLSDSCRSKFGKRRPYILCGTLMTIVACVGLWRSSNFRMPVSYFVCLLFSQVGLNVVYTAQASIVPDNCKEGIGLISGIVSCWQLLGNFLGMVWIILTWQRDYHCSYGAYIVLLSFAVLVVCRINERPSNLEPQSPFTWMKLRDSFSIDMEGDRDFFLVFVGRMFFYISMSCQTFTQYYLRDMLLIESENTIHYHIAVLMLVGTFVGMCASYPLGKLSDCPQVGRKCPIYFACATMATVYTGYLFVPMIFSPGQNAIFAIYALGCFYGLGMACYCSVDYALALDCLPEKQKGSSEALGLWGVAGFVGSSVGPVLGGAVLQLHVQPGGGYSYQGYALMTSMGIATFTLCAIVTSRIKTVP